MSARMETEPVSWESAERTCRDVTGAALSQIEVEHLVCRGQRDELGSSLRTQAEPEKADREQKRRGGSDREEQWNSWFGKREKMRTEIKRGWELLEQVQRELAALRARLDDWAGYEVVCGKNPLSDYMQAIAAKERIEQYLPMWLKQREEQLHALDRQIEHHAAREGVEQLA